MLNGRVGGGRGLLGDSWRDAGLQGRIHDENYTRCGEVGWSARMMGWETESGVLKM